jgi:hypothetical protein
LFGEQSLQHTPQSLLEPSWYFNSRIEVIMDEKIRQAITRQVEKEPFAKKFGLQLIDLQ